MFGGFPKDAVQFLTDLRENNDKHWFSANKSRYKQNLEGPAREFVQGMEDRLGR